jgi:hypothetical protein
MEVAMTKLRNAGSFEDAAFEVVRILTAAKAGQATGLSPKTIRDYTDPDRAGRPSLETAVKLDAACFAESGRAPFLEAYTRQLANRTSDAPPRSGDVLSEALDVPGAVGRLLDTVRRTTLPSSPRGATLSDNERAKVLKVLKEPRRELDELEAAVLSRPEK